MTKLHPAGHKLTIRVRRTQAVAILDLSSLTRVPKIQDHISTPAPREFDATCARVLPFRFDSLGQVAGDGDYFVFEANFMEGAAHAEPVHRLLLLCST